MVGRDEHNHSTSGKNYLAQTPKNMKTDGIDVEFAEAFADEDDKKARARSNAAEKRVKEK